MKRNRQLSFADHRMTTGRGGPRQGAGRPRGPRPRVLHRARPAAPGRYPLHVTIRVRADVPSLRSARLVRELRRSLVEACERGTFRVVHYSLMDDHVHCIVEASGRRALACGMKSLGARLARAVNRVFERTGPVLDGRYHVVSLRTPLQVHRAVRYVLLNARKHARRPGRGLRIDPASSGRWFDFWRERAIGTDPIGGTREVALPRCWLLRIGWRRHGRIGLTEIPGPAADT